MLLLKVLHNNLQQVNEFYIIDTKFFHNTGSCIIANDSNVYLYQDVLFYDNTALVGAALCLDCCQDTEGPGASFIYVFPDTKVDNTACYYGGGTAVNLECHYSHCFYQNSSNLKAFESNVCMENNKALKIHYMDHHLPAV